MGDSRNKVAGRTASETRSHDLSRVERPLQRGLQVPQQVLGRLAIVPRGTSQSVPVSCAHPVSFPFTDSCCGLVGVCLGACVNQWDRITSNVFIRNVWNGYMLEFAQGNALPLSRAPIAFESTQVDSGRELLSEPFQSCYKKGATERLTVDRLPGFYVFSALSGTAAINRSSTCHV